MRTIGGAGLGILLIALLVGCFQETSFPMRPDDVVFGSAGEAKSASAMQGESTRAWLVETHERLKHLLPANRYGALLTDAMSAEGGEACDVFGHFRKDPKRMHQLFYNLSAYFHTAQSVNAGYAIDKTPPDWEGFSSVWIPVAPGVEYHGRLGLVKEGGEIREADCIVVLPGLLGDNSTLRTRDLSQGLRSAGFHVLAVELRGHGQTESRYPNITHNFGITETADLLKVSEWLVAQPHIRDTGMIGFSWGANLVLLAAWLDGCGLDHPSLAETVTRRLQPFSREVHYRAGLIALATVVPWEAIMDRLDEPVSFWESPPLSFVQGTIRARMERKGYTPVSGSLRELIAHEFANSVFTASFPIPDGYRFLRLVPYGGFDSGDKLECARVPTLIVHAANDPLTSAQSVADMVAATENPNVAAVILPGGGHVGFAPYARSYYYSLIVNFFDPDRGAAAGRRVCAKRSDRGTIGGRGRRCAKRFLSKRVNDKALRN